MLLPSSNAPIMRSRIVIRLWTTAASRLPCLASRSIEAREAPVSAVSLAEKNAETSRQPMTMENVSQSMATITQVGVICTSGAGKLARKKVTNQRRLDIGDDHRLTDGFQQDEGQPSAPDLLILRHQFQHRIGADLFLGKARD